MLSTEEEERSGRKRRDEGRGQTRRHQRHMSGKNLFQTEKCKENWTNQKASGTMGHMMSDEEMFQKEYWSAFSQSITSKNYSGPKWGHVMKRREKPI